MSWIADVVPGTTITALWGNSIRNQVVSTHASAAARTSAIPSPAEGMVSYLADTDRVDFYTTAWKRLLDDIFGKGLVYGKRKADGVTMASAISAETTLLTKTITVEPNRTYELWARVGWTGSASNATSQLRIKESSTQLVSSGENDAPTTPFTAISECRYTYVTGAAQTSIVINVTFAPLNGGGTRTVIAYATDPFEFQVRDTSGQISLIEA